MMKARVGLCALLVTLLPVAPGLSAGERLTMTVSPAHSFAPANLRVYVRVEPNANNRALEIVAESDGFYRSSFVALDGERAPRTVLLEFRSLPSGDYEIRGVLADATGHERAHEREHVMVMSSRGDR